MLKIALINVHAERYRTSETIGATNIAYLAAHARTYLDCDSDIRLDVVAERLLQDFRPDLVGLSSTTENFSLALKDIQLIRQQWPNLPIVLGGPHISALPAALPRAGNVVGVMGEGEDSFFELLQVFRAYGRLEPEALGGIPSLVYHQQSQLRQTPPRQLDHDLDRFPMPARDLLHSIPERHQPALLTSRGCPFRCTFCSTRMLWKDIRFHSPERVIAELYDILRYFPRDTSVRIDDDLFTLNFPRLRKIAAAIRAEGLHRKIDFTCSARANTLSDKVCQTLREMNVRNIFLGLESGSDHTLRELKGPIISVGHNQEALELCQKYGFWVSGSFIIGSPQETRADLARTFWFIQQNFDRFGKLNICYATPYPDTPLWQKALEQGRIGPGFKDWDTLNLYYDPDRSLFLNENYSRAEFNQIYGVFYRQLQQKWLEIPASIPQQLEGTRYREQLRQQVRTLLPTGRILVIGPSWPELSEDLAPGQELAFAVPRMGQMPELEGRFDMILVDHTLEWLWDPDLALASLKASLDPGGLCLVLSYSASHISHLAELLIGRWQPVLFGLSQRAHLKLYTPRTLEQLFARAGYLIQSSQTCQQPIKNVPPMLETALQLLEQHLGLTRPPLEINSSLYLLQPEPLTPTETGAQAQAAIGNLGNC